MAPTSPSDDEDDFPSDGAPSPLKRDLVAGLEKGLAVIEAFGPGRPRLTIAEVAARTRLTRAAARRYLLTLQHLGFVRQERNTFALTPRVLRLAQSYMYSARLPRIVQPALERLSLGLKEASSAGVLDGADVLCIAASDAGRAVSATLHPGTRVPAYCTANGRVLLAALPSSDLQDWLARQAPFDARTPQTTVDAAALAATVAQAREQGWACVDQELEGGLRTLAVPLLDHRGGVVAALNLSVHARRMTTDELLDQGLPALRAAQAELRQLL